jgi:hypothetical protein
VRYLLDPLGGWLFWWVFRHFGRHNLGVAGLGQCHNYKVVQEVGIVGGRVN